MFIEFPKALYLGGDVQARARVVSNEIQEEDARAEGFLPIDEAPAPVTSTEPVEEEMPALAEALQAAVAAQDKPKAGKAKAT